MFTMQFEFSTNSLNKISSEAAIVFAYTSKEKGKFIPLLSFKKIDKENNGELTRIAKLENFTGKKNEVITVIPQANTMTSRIIIIGLGKKEQFAFNDLREIIGSFVKHMRKRINSASLVLPTKEDIDIDSNDVLHAIVEGFELGNYVFIKYKKEEKVDRNLSTIIIGEQKENIQLKRIVKRAQSFAKATNLARDLVNEQSAIATPTYLATLAQEIAKSSSQISCKVFDKKEAEKMGMNAFLGVARAADTLPKFIHLEYTPKKKSKEKIAIVGKGITFDSGGINIKPGEHMNDMKMDMAGAAVVLGVFSVINEIQPDVAVIGLIAATANMVSGASLVPGDVVRALNGKTIEIINTDAEGRVTLADSLSYAVKEEATKIFDLGTLTGAAEVALGVDIGALFSNNPEFAKQIEHAASEEGEKVWELPLEPAYKKLNKSNIADISNLASSRYGGAITAALFLEEFVDKKPWVHIDIAGPAFASKGNNLGPEGGTGFGVRTVLKLLSL